MSRRERRIRSQGRFGLKYGLLTVAALGVAGLAVQVGYTDRLLIRRDATAAAQPLGLSSDGAVLRADRALQKGSPKEAERWARIAIGRSPLNSDALELLAMAREDQGGDPGAFMQAGVALGWRSRYAQLWSMDAAVERGDFGTAVLRADALLRQGARKDELTALLRRLAANARARAALVQRLSANPPWRSDYLGDLAALTAPAFAAHEAVLDQLRMTDAPTRADEVGAYAFRLLADGRYADANAFWRRFNPRATALVTDPSFERVGNGRSTSSPFEWQGQKLLGAYLEAESTQNRPGNALRVQAERAVSGKLLEQLLVLPGGRYELLFEARETAIGSIEPLEWKVLCVGGSASVTADPLQPIRRSAEWSLFRQRIRVPERDCPAQRLELWIYHSGTRTVGMSVRQVRLQQSG